MFSHIGVGEVEALLCPGGQSWSDSAFLMRPIDLMRSARFVMNGGSWGGKQLLSESFVKEATSCLTATDDVFGFDTLEGLGYGYLIWRTNHNSFFFNGMGCQLAVCSPDKDMILVYNGDNQGNPHAKTKIIDGFFDIIYDSVSDSELPEYTGEPIGEHSLFCLKGNASSPMAERINGKRFVMEQNQLGLKEFTLELGSEEGAFNYVNGTGEHSIHFGFGHNVFEKFTEEGYSDLVGSVAAPGNRYDSAASGEWVTENQLRIRVQIIDKYFGNLGIILAFRDDLYAAVSMGKSAEDFLWNYNGKAIGRISDN